MNLNLPKNSLNIWIMSSLLWSWTVGALEWKLRNITKNISTGLPWWFSGKEFTCSHGFNPWSRRIRHAVQQVSLCATTIESVIWSPGPATPEPTRPRVHAPQKEKVPQWEAHVPQLESSPCSLQQEKGLVQKDTRQPKRNKLINNIYYWKNIELNYTSCIWHNLISLSWNQL